MKLRKCHLFSQLTLNVEDRRADWHSGKNTLAVILGDKMSGKLQLYFTLSGYASLLMLGRLGPVKVRGNCE